MKFFLYLLIPIFLFCDTGKNLKETNSDVFDLTYQDVNNITEIEPDKFLEKVFISVPKDEILTLRTPFVFNCGKDKYNNSYCPSQLAKAREYWSYDDGFSELKTGTVTDYAKIKGNIHFTNPVIKRVCYKFPVQPSSCGMKGEGKTNIANINNVKSCGGLNNYEIFTNQEINKNDFSSDAIIFSSEIVPCYYFGSKNLLSCQDGYSFNKNKNLCEKNAISCPDGYELTKGSEKLKGECKRVISYSYYDYKCSDSSDEQNHNFNEQNIGGDCNKVDTDNTKVNNELAESCNSATPPKNNCKRKEYACNSNEIKPAFVDGEWKCSPFQCNSNMKCGYGSCNGMKTSNDKIMPYAYHPIESLTRSGDACTPIPCDTEYEYDDGIATKVDKNYCPGEIVNGKCIKYEYANKIKTNDISGDYYISKIKTGNWTIPVGLYDNILYDKTMTGVPLYGYISTSNVGEKVYVDYYSGHISKSDADYFSTGYMSKTPFNNSLPLKEIKYSWFSPSNNSKIIYKCTKGYSEYGNPTKCRKGTELPMKNYSYYKYECKDDKNSFGEKWELTQSANDPGCVDDTFGGCTDFTKETSVCRRQIHTCPNGSGTCKKNNNGQYQCSLDNCKDGKMPCIGQLCDYVAFDRISYCLDYKCPAGAGFSEKDGKCLKEECPKGTYLVNGKCLDSKF